MSDTPGTEISLTICTNSPPAGQLGLYLNSDDNKREPATAEVVISPVSGERNVCINAQGMKEPLIVPVKVEKTDAILVRSVKNIKQAWGVAINHNDQVIVVTGREGLKEDMAQVSPSCSRDDLHKEACEGEVKEKAREGELSKEEKVVVDLKVERDNDHDGDCILILSLKGEKISSFGPKGKRDGEFNMPRGVAVDEEDNIYVVDKMNSRIQKFSPSGQQCLASVGKKGNGKLEFDKSH